MPAPAVAPTSPATVASLINRRRSPIAPGPAPRSFSSDSVSLRTRNGHGARIRMPTMSAPLPALPHLPTGLYRHYRGRLYTVLHVARHSETLEPQVVYRAEYGAREIWVRPYAMFVETVGDGAAAVPRFRPVGDDG